MRWMLAAFLPHARNLMNVAGFTSTLARSPPPAVCRCFRTVTLMQLRMPAGVCRGTTATSTGSTISLPIAAGARCTSLHTAIEPSRFAQALLQAQLRTLGCLLTLTSNMVPTYYSCVTSEAMTITSWLPR